MKLFISSCKNFYFLKVSTNGFQLFINTYSVADVPFSQSWLCHPQPHPEQPSGPDSHNMCVLVYKAKWNFLYRVNWVVNQLTFQKGDYPGLSRWAQLITKILKYERAGQNIQSEKDLNGDCRLWRRKGTRVK